MNELPNKAITIEYFLLELEKEVVEMQSATTYRQATAKMALDMAKQTDDVHLFKVKEQVYNELKSKFTNADEERLLDVSKFLNTLFNHLDLRENLPDQIRSELNKRAKNRQPLYLEDIKE